MSSSIHLAFLNQEMAVDDEDLWQNTLGRKDMQATALRNNGTATSMDCGNGIGSVSVWRLTHLQVD